MGKGITLSIADEGLELLPERALYWPKRRTLIVTDLHWGKSDAFRLRGIPIPDQAMDDELSRLSQLVRDTKSQRIIVLGDLIHSKMGITENLSEKIKNWRRNLPEELVVIVGNHDRSWKSLPKEWNIQWLPELKEEVFYFTHHPRGERSEGFIWAGHLHPTYVVRSPSDKLRLPCFHIGPNEGVLPAFNFFTRGLEMPKGPQDRVFVIADNKVFEVN